MSINDTQQQSQARARPAKCTKLPNIDSNLLPRLHRPPLDGDDMNSLLTTDIPAELMVEDRRWTPHDLQSMILRVLEAPFLEAKL